MVEVYYSGIEGSEANLKKILESGIHITHLMTAYSVFRNKKEHAEVLKDLRALGVKIIVDSGAHAFIYAEEVKSKKNKGDWHESSKLVEEFKGKEKEYFNEYLEWLKANRDAYDYAVELDLQAIVGQEIVEQWRTRLLEEKLPIIFVLHVRAGDNGETLRSWKERGIEYAGLGEPLFDFNKTIMLGQIASKLGLKFHLFGYTPKELFKYKGWLTSVDSSSWLSATKLAQGYQLRGKELEQFSLREDKLKTASALRDIVFDVIGREDAEEKVKRKKFAPFNYYNIVQMQRWADANNGVKGYTQQLEKIEEGAMPAPPWLNSFDKAGRPKATYLSSRFNNYRHGAYATQIQSMSMYCDTCPVGGMSSAGYPLCPKYEAGGICWFLPNWKKLGMKTRNKKEILTTLRDLVADAFTRYEFSRFQEQLTGITDKNVTALYKELMTSLELLNRVEFGVQNVNTVNMLNVGNNKVSVTADISQSLEKIRNYYGEELEKKIKKRIEKDIFADANIVEGEEVKKDGN